MSQRKRGDHEGSVGSQNFEQSLHDGARPAVHVSDGKQRGMDQYPLTGRQTDAAESIDQIGERQFVVCR